MSELRVWKYQATGNDFVMTYDPEDRDPLSAEEVRALCDRRFGIGGDGSIRVTAGLDGRRPVHQIDHSPHFALELISPGSGVEVVFGWKLGPDPVDQPLRRVAAP